MLLLKKRRYFLSIFIFLLLIVGTIVGFLLLKHSQDTRQQASEVSCQAGDPYCSCNLWGGDCVLVDPNGVREIVESGTTESNRGILSTSFTGQRPRTESACSGVWMNDFCYMPGDEIAGGYIVVESGKYNYPYLEKKEVYESLAFNSETVSNRLGTAQNLGDNCGGKGLNIDGICYAFGAVINGYLVMPNRSTDCNNNTGDYCYAHLKKIEVAYDEWQAAVSEYESTGDDSKLEELYQRTYGISFQPGSLYDANASNADLLRAQALIASLTSAAVIQDNARAENAALEAKGTLTAQEQATYDFNRRIIEYPDLAKHYQILDQLNGNTSQKIAINNAISQMYSDLVTTENEAELNAIASAKFKEIFGYDPSSKYGNLNGVLGALGIDPNQLSTDRANYSQAVATAIEEQAQHTENINQEYQAYVTGESDSINDLKQAALDAGVITESEITNLSETELLALLLSKFSDISVTEARQNAGEIVAARNFASQEQTLTQTYIANQQSGTSSQTNLADLYKLYVGTAPSTTMSTSDLQKEIAKHNSQVALSLYAQTQDVSYLNSYYLSNSSSTSLEQIARVVNNPKVLLNSIYGVELGSELYQDLVIPNKFNQAIANFSSDAGSSLSSVCREMGIPSCNIDENSATTTLALMLEQMYGDQAELNIPELATNYSNQIYATVKADEAAEFWDTVFANYAAAKVAENTGFIFSEDSVLAENLSTATNNQLVQMQEYSTAVTAADIFNASQVFAYANDTENRAALSDYTWGLSYGNALMADNIFNREFTIENLGLNFGQTVGLTFNQLTTQLANVDVAQNIAANYATSKYYDYIGPADTQIANIALSGAEKLGVLDYNYQEAQAGYYADRALKNLGESLGQAMVTLGANYAASQMNQMAWNPSLNTDANLTYVDPITYAEQAREEFKASYHQDVINDLYEEYVAVADANNTSKLSFEQFLEDPEVQRSSQELNYERLEKVVAPTAAIITLPILTLTGAAPAVMLGMASSAFSLYQGAGMKAQALELQRIDIESRENAIIQSYAESGASAQEIADMRADLDLQVDMLNKQGNLMLANSAVAALTSVGGWASTIGNAGKLTGTALGNAFSTSGQILTKTGQISGIGLNTYNTVNSGITAYQAFEQGNIWEGITSATGAFVSASGVVGNTFGVLGPTTLTNKIDYVLDAMNVPAGAGMDLQQVSQACFSGSDAFSEKDCTNAWIGLALSAGQNISQVSSSYKNYQNDNGTARLTDLQKQLDAVDLEILALSGQRNITADLTINDLVVQRLGLVEQISSIDPNLQIAKLGFAEDLLAVGNRFSLDLERQAQQALDSGQDAQALYLLEQATLLKNKPTEITALNKEIAAIDEKITKQGLTLSAEERTTLQQERSSLLTKLENATVALPDIESLRKQAAIVLETAKADTANQELSRLLALDTQKAELVTIYAPRSEEVASYRNNLLNDDQAVKLETDANRRLISLSALEESIARLNDLEGQKQALSNAANADSEVGQEVLAKLDAEIIPLKKIVAGLSVDNRSFLQKIADVISPNRASRDAYHQALDLTRQAEDLKTKLADSNLGEVDIANLKNQLAEVNHRLMEQKYVLAQEVANPSKNIVQRIADIVPNWQTNQQITNLRTAAKKLGTANLELATSLKSKQAELEKLKADPDADAQKIANLEAELADLSQTATNVLKGSNALIKIDRNGTYEGKEGTYTRYVVTEAGTKAGIKQAQLEILNKELANFEEFRRRSQTDAEIAKYGLFEIYSGTDSFKDQDIFLLAEIEAFGAGRRGTVFGALPGMGKTDVVMPFNILLKQRLTNEPQFIVFPEAKLMKPWTSDANYTPNKQFIDYVEANFGKGSVVIVKANDTNVDPAAIARAKFVITTKDVAFDLQSTKTTVGLALRNKWRSSYVHADEVDWTFNPNENYKISSQQLALQSKPEYALYLAAQKSVLGLDENGNFSGKGLSSLRNLINQLETSKSIPEGIIRTSDGKGGKFADVELEKQVLSEWLATWGGQSKITDLDMLADISVIREKINTYLSTDADLSTHARRAELAMINETVNFLSRVPGEDYGLSSNTRVNGEIEEIINSIAPKEQNRDTGRSYSAVAESLLYNTLGARVLGVNNQIDLGKLTVGEGGSEINYALLMLESKGFSLYTGTPETVAKLYEMAYGIELKVFTDSAIADAVARFKKSDSALFTDLNAQIAARLNENRDQIFINMVAGVKSNEMALQDLVARLAVTDVNQQTYKKLILVGASGKLTEYDLIDGHLHYARDFSSTDELNLRTATFNDDNTRYIKFYEYGAHIGVDTKNNVELSRAVGLCSGCDETTFAQGINRVRVQIETLATGGSIAKSAPMDVVWLDAPTNKSNPTIDDFALALKSRQEVNEALAEVYFKETLLKNSVDATFADLIELAQNGKKGFLGLGAYQVNQNLVTQLEAAQQKWKETSQMNYMLGSDDLSAQNKLSKTANQVAGVYEELSRIVAGSGEPARLLAKRADGALGNNRLELVFSGDNDYKVLGERPSYRQIVELINQSSKHLENVNIAFTNRSSQPEVVQNEVAKAADSVSGDNVSRDTTQEVAVRNVIQEAAVNIKQRFDASSLSKVLRTPTSAISAAFSSAYSALTNLFSKEEIPTEVLAQRSQVISDLKITNPQTLARLESFKTADEISNFVTERQALYQKLKDQFAALNTVRPAINNEEDYQVQENNFNQTVAEIKDLQARSGLAFVEVAADGTLSRVNENQFKNLSTFKAKAEVQIEKLAKDTEAARLLAEQQALEEANRLEQEKLAKEEAERLIAEEAAKQEAAAQEAADEQRRLAEEAAQKTEEAHRVAEEEQQRKLAVRWQAITNFVQTATNFIPENMTILELKKNIAMINRLIEVNAQKDYLAVASAGDIVTIFESLRSLAGSLQDSIDKNVDSLEELYTVGRSEENYFKSDLAYVSKNHAVFLKDKAGNLFIKDLGSSNGTFINGQKLDSNKIVALRTGDLIEMGIKGLSTAAIAVIEENGKTSLMSVDHFDSQLDTSRREQQALEAEKLRVAGNDYVSRIKDGENEFINSSNQDIVLINPLNGEKQTIKKGRSFALDKNYLVKVKKEKTGSSWFMLNQDGSTESFTIQVSNKTAALLIDKHASYPFWEDGSVKFDKTKIKEVTSVDILNQDGVVVRTLHFTDKFNFPGQSFLSSKKEKIDNFAANVAWATFRTEDILSKKKEGAQEILLTSKEVCPRAYATSGNFILSYKDDSELFDVLATIAHEHTHATLGSSPLIDFTEGIAMQVQKIVGEYTNAEFLKYAPGFMAIENYNYLARLQRQGAGPSATQIENISPNKGMRGAYEWSYFSGYFLVNAILETQGEEALAKFINAYNQSKIDYSLRDTSKLKISKKDGEQIHNYEAIQKLLSAFYGENQFELIQKKYVELMETSHLLGLMDKIEGVTYLGRSAENDVVANQSSVSRVHALVAKDVLGFLYISDLKSQNGTYVNGKRIDSNYRLQADDEVILGSLDGAHSVFKVVKNTVLNEHNIAVNTYELEAVSGVETKEDQLAREQQKNKEAKRAQLLVDYQNFKEKFDNFVKLSPQALSLEVLNQQLEEIQRLIEVLSEKDFSEIDEENNFGEQFKNIAELYINYVTKHESLVAEAKTLVDEQSVVPQFSSFSISELKAWIENRKTAIIQQQQQRDEALVIEANEIIDSLAMFSSFEDPDFTKALERLVEINQTLSDEVISAKIAFYAKVASLKEMKLENSLYENLSHEEIEELILERQEAYRQLKYNFLKLDYDIDIDNEVEFQERLSEIERIVGKILAHEQKIGKKFFEDGVQKKFNQNGDWIGYEFVVLDNNIDYADFLIREPINEEKVEQSSKIEQDSLKKSSIGLINTPEKAIELVKEQVTFGTDFAHRYYDSLVRAGVAHKIDDSNYEVNVDQLGFSSIKAEQGFIKHALSIYPALRYLFQNFNKTLNSGGNWTVEQQQVLINRLLDPQAKVFFNQAGLEASLEEYFQEIYQESVEIIRIDTQEKLNQDDISAISSILTAEELESFLSVAQDLPVATVLIRKGDQELKVPIISISYEGDTNGFTKTILDRPDLRPIFINNLVKKRSLLEILQTITHEVDHSVHFLANPFKLDDTIPNNSNDVLDYIFNSKRFNGNTIDLLLKARGETDYSKIYSTLGNTHTVISEMGGEIAGLRFLKTFANGLKSDEQNTSLVGAIDFLALGHYINRAISINHPGFEPYSLGMVLGDAIESKYGTSEFLRILNQLSISSAQVLLQDSLSDLESILKVNHDLLINISKVEYLSKGPVFVDLNNFNQVSVPEIIAEVEDRDTLMEKFSNSLDKVAIYLQVAKLIPRQATAWADITNVLYQIVNHLSLDNQIFIDYVQGLTTTEMNEEDFEKMSYELKMLLQIYSSQLDNKIINSQDLQKLLMQLAFEKTGATLSLSSELKPYHQELHKLIIELLGTDSSASKFSSYTGQKLSLPTVFDENGKEVIDVLTFDDLRRKILLEIKYKDYLSSRVIFIDLSDNPPFEEAKKRFETAIQELESKQQTEAKEFESTVSKTTNQTNHEQTSLDLAIAKGLIINQDLIDNLRLLANSQNSVVVEKYAPIEKMLEQFLSNPDSLDEDNLFDAVEGVFMLLKLKGIDLTPTFKSSDSQDAIAGINLLVRKKELLKLQNVLSIDDTLNQEVLSQLLTSKFAQSAAFFIANYESSLTDQQEKQDFLEKLMDLLSKVTIVHTSSTESDTYSKKIQKLKETLSQMPILMDEVETDLNQLAGQGDVDGFILRLNKFAQGLSNIGEVDFANKVLDLANQLRVWQDDFNSSNFSSLCSDCNQVRLDTQAGVEKADALLKEAEELSKQATEAKNTNDPSKAIDLEKQAQAKQKEALAQLNNTRLQVVNSHGMQNQCVQLYLNAWVDTREAIIRKTKADVNNAIDSVYKATVIAEELLANKTMDIKEGGFLGIGQQKEIINLSDDELSQIKDLLVGNEELGIEGLNSFASFAKNGKQVTRTITGGLLMNMENDVVADQISSVRVTLRNLYINIKNNILFQENNNPRSSIKIDLTNKIDFTKLNFGKLRTVGGAISSLATNGLNAINVWFRSLTLEESIVVNTTDEPVAFVSTTPAVSITVTSTPTPTKSPTPTPSLTFTPSPTPTINQDENEESFWKKLKTGLSESSLFRTLRQILLLIGYDSLLKSQEMIVVFFKLNEYKDALPPYDPDSKESQELAALGIYEDYVCQDGDAYSQDLTKQTDNLSKMGDCQNGCYKGACLAKVGDSCDGGKTVFAADDNKCLLNCEAGKFVESNSCGHADVEAYSNKAYWEVYRSLGTISEEVLDDTKVNIYATWKPSLEDDFAVGFAMTFAMNKKPIVIGGGYANIPLVVVHEYFHHYGAQKYRLYPDWAPFSKLIALPAAILDVTFHGIDTAVPRDYVNLLGYEVKEYIEYNSLENIFYYDENNYPITGYGGFPPDRVQISEDFADSASWYVNQPCELRSASPIRYNYFKDNVFNGVEFLPGGGCNN